MADTTTLVSDQDGARLDAYVASARLDLTRSRIQQLIRQGHILVNDIASRPATRLRPGDRISVYVPPVPPVDLRAEDIPLEVVYEDNHVLIIDKPAGLTVHPAPGHPHGTLVNALLARYPELEGIGAPTRPGIVHRLDADTSGLMAVARTQFAYESLVLQLKDRTVTKVYFALVRGYLTPPEGTVEAPVGRNPQDRKLMGVVSGGRDATTSYRTLQQYEGFALLEVRPHTGRTHQIRVHMAAMGHPVAGDRKYGGRVPFLRRQFLHAHRLGLCLPDTGKDVEFASPLPTDLQEALDGLKPRT